MIRLLASLAVLLSIEAIASAQTSPNGGAVAAAQFDPTTIFSADPDSPTVPISSVEGPGVKIGEGTVLHPVFGLELGAVSNVFYTPTNPEAAGILRLMAQIGTGSLPNGRLQANDGDAGTDYGDFQYRASARVSYDQMISSDSTVTNVASFGNFPSGLGLGASLLGVVNPSGKLTFTADEEYTRLLRAANFETDTDTNRDLNNVSLNLAYKPQGRSLSGYLYVLDTVDVFEASSQQFADRTLNVLGVHPMWRWLPMTVVYTDVSIGYDTGIGSSSIKATSEPFTAVAGIATLLTEKLTLNAQGGYTYASYSEGPGYSDFIGNAQLGYRYAPLGRITATWNLWDQDSINANYYRENVFALWWQHQVDQFTLMAQPELHLRTYEGINIPLVVGPPDRDDTILSVIAGVRYNFHNWIAMTLDYHYSQLITSYRYTEAAVGMPLDPEFTRHEVMLGLRIAM